MMYFVQHLGISFYTESRVKLTLKREVRYGIIDISGVFLLWEC